MASETTPFTDMHSLPDAPSDKTLDAFLLEDFAGLPFSRKVFFLRELAAWVRQSHDAGRFFQGRGAGTVRLRWNGADGLEFERTCEKRSFRFSLCSRKKIRDLAALYSQSCHRVGRADFFRFLKTYAGYGLRLRDLRSLAREIEQAAQAAIFRSLKRQENACWKTNRDFRVGTFGRFVVRRRASEEAAALASALLPDPERLLAGGEKLPGRGSNCLTAKIRSGGRSYVLKRYTSQGWAYKLKHAFCRPRGSRVWGASWAILARGVSIPVPILCLEERKACFPGVSYLVFEYLPDSRTLTSFWPEAGEGRKKELLARLAISLGKLHRLRVLHGDTNWDNVLIREEGQLVLIDLDCSRFSRRIGPKRKEKDIQHVFRDLCRFEKTPGELAAFFRRVWRKWAFLLTEQG
jgi:tRNA A-37 threonylcarbamoyl transferase component Bud32